MGYRLPRGVRWLSASIVLLLAGSASHAGPLPELRAATLLRAPDVQYLGAFRLPGGRSRPRTFAYGGNAMTFRANGEASAAGDGLPGSLFVSGHDRMAYGELADGSQVAEISIPVPAIASRPRSLPRARFLQRFRDVAVGQFQDMDELPRMGMQYLDAPPTGPLIHLAWGQHFEPENPTATHAWFSPRLRMPALEGPWFVGDISFYGVNGYLFEIPAAWADDNATGRVLATGRYRDGGWSGMGPALHAYRPWVDDSGAAAAAGTRLAATTLLEYRSTLSTEDIRENLEGYQHADEWEGGAWITTTTGKSAVLFAGTKATGAKYWYGFVNPAGADIPCVAGDFVGQFTVCRLADGTTCPPSDLLECDGHNDFRGWWSARFAARFILYDPDDLAAVARGSIPSWSPQPYASIDIDEHLFLNPSRVEEAMLGTGVQRRYRIGDVAYDRAHDLLYVLELFADSTRPVVHVWRLR